MADVLLLSAADVRAVFDLPAAIASQRAAFGALGRKEARLAPRLLLDGPDGDVAFCYVSRLPGTGTVAKFGSVHPGNAARGLPTVAALVTVQDPADGRPIAIIEGKRSRRCARRRRARWPPTISPCRTRRASR